MINACFALGSLRGSTNLSWAWVVSAWTPWLAVLSLLSLWLLLLAGLLTWLGTGWLLADLGWRCLGRLLSSAPTSRLAWGCAHGNDSRREWADPTAQPGGASACVGVCTSPAGHIRWHGYAQIPSGRCYSYRANEHGLRDRWIEEAKDVIRTAWDNALKCSMISFACAFLHLLPVRTLQEHFRNSGFGS